MKCPRDYTPLKPEYRGNILLDRCPGCTGLWFDFSELSRAVGSWNDLPREIMAPTESLACPKGCGNMNSHYYSDKRRTVVDRCPTCLGIWLDPHELEAILQEVYPQLQLLFQA